MGCDIHLFAEVKKKKTFIEKLQFWKPAAWQTIDTWCYEDRDDDEPYLKVDYSNFFYTGGRNYNLFCALCGVRASMFEGGPTILSNPKGLPLDTCKEIKAIEEVWAGDSHSHSYNTLKELLEFDWNEYGETCNKFLEEVIPKMKAQNVGDEDVRIVYFFDN